MPNELPVLQIDLASLLPASEQIVRGLRATLLAGRFRPGDQLPSVRQLAVDLGVHHNTVAGAYRQLAEEGWLELRRGRGATVIERPAPAPTPRAEAEFRKRLEELVVKALAEGVPSGAVSGELAVLAAKLQEGELAKSRAGLMPSTEN
ncbi:MAG: GntR family transcriptional regulator [Terriglobia bacterium]|jgi:GntR family transcriptional regulator